VVKIALVILHADPNRGGAERYTIDLAHALSGRSHDVRLLASTFAADVPAGLRVVLPSDSPTRLGRYRRFLDALDAHLAGEKYDVVHAMLPVRQCDIYHPHAGLAAESVASGHLKHDSPASRWLSRWGNRLNSKRRYFARVERELLDGPKPPILLCLSQYVKASVLRHYALPESRIATLFNGIDLAKFDPAARPEAGSGVREKFNIKPADVVALMIAQDFERKGLKEAVQALSGIRGLLLLVVGKENAAFYESLAKKTRVADRVRFAGATDDPYAFYRAADCFVLPTRHDPCSLVVLEALAMGLPVVSTVCNGACEIMTDGVHGFVLRDPGDVQVLSDRLRQLVDLVARRRMSEACMALRPRLSQEHHVEELLRVYLTISSNEIPRRH
jgi:UDP-glucose:(heptosyl)LPS alpha-1,3-glucosyltransferase